MPANWWRSSAVWVAAMADVRVLIADRSTSVRAVLRRFLDQSPGVTVVAESGNGPETVELVAKHLPDALVLDLDLPMLGGRALVDAITATRRIPIFVITPNQNRELTKIAFAAHENGVVAVIPKPEVPKQWEELGQSLGKSVAESCVATDGVTGMDEPDETPVVSRQLEFLCVGASTGGPGAVHELLQSLGPRPSLGIMIVQHITGGFESIFAEWLASDLKMDVRVATDGDVLQRGQVLVAPPGSHTMLAPGGVVRLDTESSASGGHRPAVDVLFRSLLEHSADRVAAVLLSGMGIDGAEAMSDLRRAKVLTIAQDMSSCAVFGMPRAAIQRGAVSFALPPALIGRLLAVATGEAE